MQSVEPVDSRFIWVRRGIAVAQGKQCGYLTVMTPPTANLLVMQVSCEALHRTGLNLMFNNIEVVPDQPWLLSPVFLVPMAARTVPELPKEWR